MCTEPADARPEGVAHLLRLRARVRVGVRVRVMVRVRVRVLQRCVGLGEFLGEDVGRLLPRLRNTFGKLRA